MIKLVLTLAGLLWASLAGAETFYVGPSGSDSHTCLQAQNSSTPRLTIAAATSDVAFGGCATAGNGDVVIVKNGTYTDGLTQANFVRGTSWANALTLRAENRHGAIIRPDSSYQAAFDFDTAATPLQYVIIDGFDIDGSTLPDAGPPVYPRGLIKIWGNCTNGWVNHIRFQHNKMHGYVSTGNNGSTFVTAGDACNPNTTALDILFNDIYENGTDSQFSNAFYIQTGGNRIEGNTCHDNIGDCFRLSQQNAGWPQDNVVVKNICYDLTRSCVGMNGDQARNNLVANNIMYSLSGDACIDGSESDPQDNIVVFNTCYNALYGARFSGTRNITRYNIFRSTGTPTVELGTGNTFSDNITADPLFVSTVTPDFHLQTGSPAIGAGSAVSGVGDDYDGLARPQGGGHDAGAYEFTEAPPATRAFGFSGVVKPSGSIQFH